MTGADPYDAWIAPLRVTTVIFDTMIIRHLCAAGAGPALAQAFAGRMMWPEAVDAELRLQARSVTQLRTFLSASPATVLEADTDDETEIEDIRVDMYTKRAARLSPTEHLGEAQCLYFADKLGLPLATNDNKAREWARNVAATPAGAGFVGPRVVVFHVVEVLYALTRVHACPPEDVWTYYEAACNISGLYEVAGFAIPGARTRVVDDATRIHGLGP